MSAQTRITRKRIPDLVAMKGQNPIVCLTAYATPMARLLDPHADMLLVGDSLGMVIYGYDSTLPVTLEMMILHTQAVMRGSQQAAVVLDMPFGSYQESPEQAYRNCAQAMARSGCSGVKIEGGAEMAKTAEFLVQRGIPVLAHAGLLPQHVNVLGGYRYQGRSKTSRKRILRDAKALEDAGAFAIVLEAVDATLATEISQSLSIPTIGIGASAQCDGQVLVTEDMLGMTPHTARFVKRYAQIGEAISKAVERYSKDVRARKFPGKEHQYGG